MRLLKPEYWPRSTKLRRKALVTFGMWIEWQHRQCLILGHDGTTVCIADYDRTKNEGEIRYLDYTSLGLEREE